MTSAAGRRFASAATSTLLAQICRKDTVLLSVLPLTHGAPCCFKTVLASLFITCARHVRLISSSELHGAAPGELVKLPSRSASRLRARLASQERSLAAFLCTWRSPRRFLAAVWLAVVPDGAHMGWSRDRLLPRSRAPVSLPAVSTGCRASLVSVTDRSGFHKRPFHASGGDGARPT